MADDEESQWTTEDWAKKLRQQAEDSREYRYRLYDKVDLKHRRAVLDVGCGTGAVTEDLANITTGEVVGIDIDKEKLEIAGKLLSDVPTVRLMEADVLDLPFEDESFDLVVFNIVLMHIRDQQRAVDEMARVTRAGGIVLATLEPDYAGSIDYPEDPVRPIILENIERLGADLHAGRKLKVLFSRAGLRAEMGMDTETEYILVKDNEKILDLFLSDLWVLEKSCKISGWTEEQIERYKEEKIERIKQGESFGFTPCFYAIGRKPEA